MTFADRYRRLASYAGADSDPGDPGQVLAMPVVLRIEKNEPPERASLLAAAATAVAQLCLDPRTDPAPDPDAAGGDPTGDDRRAGTQPGPWAQALDDWCDARIRKIARRARGAQWDAAGEVDGVTAEVGGARARAIVPGPVGAVDKRIARLQIGGTDVPGELEGPDGHGDGAVSLWVNPDLEMTTGKLAAQVGHGSMLAVKLMTLDAARDWYERGCPCRVRQTDVVRWQALLDAEASQGSVAVRDAGFTEIAPGSVTVIATL